MGKKINENIHTTDAILSVGTLTMVVNSLSHVGSNIALTGRTFVGKVMSLLFHMPSIFAIAFLDVYPLVILPLGSLHNRGNKNSYQMTLALIRGCPQHPYSAGVPVRGPSSLWGSDVMVRGGI